jgi:hypothetical protein
MLNLSFNTYGSFLLTVPGGTRSMSTALLRQIQLVALYQSALGVLNSKRISQTELPRLGSFEPCAQLPRQNLACNTDRADRHG